MERDVFRPGPLAEVSCEMGRDDATLIFVRFLPHPPERVWRALVDPREQVEWMPFVAERDLTVLGPVTLHVTDREGAPPIPSEVLKSKPGSLLSYRWGQDVLRWELAPAGDGTRLTLRHKTAMPEQLSSFAAGWHICLNVAGHYLKGNPIGAIIGEQAMDHGWPELNSAYARMLTVA